MSKYNQEYMLLRKRLQNRNSYYNKKYGIKPYKVPKIPKRITAGSIRALTKILSKTKPIQKLNKKMGLTPTGKIKKSTKNKIRKKSGLEQIPKKTRKKKKINKDSYLPDEASMLKESSLSFFVNVDSMDSFIAQMNLSSRRGNNTHRANVHDLSVMLRNAFEKACFADGETTVNKRLQDNAELVNRAMETIEGYYKSSDEEALQEAIDAIEDLISIITNSPIDQDTAKFLEDVYNDSLSSYLTYGDMGEQFIIEVADNKRLVIDPEKGELLDSLAI